MMSSECTASVTGLFGTFLLRFGEWRETTRTGHALRAQAFKLDVVLNVSRVRCATSSWKRAVLTVHGQRARELKGNASLSKVFRWAVALALIGMAHSYV